MQTSLKMNDDSSHSLHPLHCRGCRECEESSFIFRLVDKLPCFEIEYLNDDCHIKVEHVYLNLYRTSLFDSEICSLLTNSYRTVVKGIERSFQNKDKVFCVEFMYSCFKP